MTRKAVYVEGFDPLMEKMFVEEGWTIAPDILSADLLCLEGGADVSPELYGEDNTSSYNNVGKDVTSFGLLAMADLLEIPVVGICRGHQVLAVSHGLKLNQHIDGHNGGEHEVSYSGKFYQVSSVHHQSVISESWVDATHTSDNIVEIIQWDEMHLGVQFHPEYHQQGHECRDLFFQLLNNLNFGD